MPKTHLFHLIYRLIKPEVVPCVGKREYETKLSTKTTTTTSSLKSRMQKLNDKFTGKKKISIILWLEGKISFNNSFSGI